MTIRQTTIHGLGLFATRFISSGFDLGVAHVHMVEWLSFPQNYCRTPLGGFYNHSNDPNCKLVDSGSLKRLITIKNIESGDEITCKYTIYDIDEYPESSQ